MTEQKNFDKEETIKCPHCKADIDLGIDIEYDFDESGTGAEATVTVLNKAKEIEND